MDVLVAVKRELDEARAAERPVEYIRVSSRAVPGSPVATPLQLQDQVGVAHPLEVLIHPLDWLQFLVAIDRTAGRYGVDVGADGVRRFYGVRVNSEQGPPPIHLWSQPQE